MLHVIRHGESEYNAATSYGMDFSDPQIFNPKLTEKGRKQVSVLWMPHQPLHQQEVEDNPAKLCPRFTAWWANRAGHQPAGKVGKACKVGECRVGDLATHACCGDIPAQLPEETSPCARDSADPGWPTHTGACASHIAIVRCICLASLHVMRPLLTLANGVRQLLLV